MILTKKDLKAAKLFAKLNPSDTHDYLMDDIRKIAEAMTREQLIAFRDSVIAIRDMYKKSA